MTDVTTPTEPTSKSSGGVWIGVIGIVVGIGGLAAGGLALEQISRISPQLSQSENSQALGERTTRKLDDALRAQQRAIGAQQQTISALKAEIEGLHEALASKEGTPAPIDEAALEELVKKHAPTASAHEDTEKRIAALEQSAATQAEKFSALEADSSQEPDISDLRLLRYMALREAIEEHAPHSEALDHLVSALGDGIAEKHDVREAIATLRKTGRVPSASELYITFAAIPPKALAREEKHYVPETEQKTGFVARSKAALKELVTIERVGAEASAHQVIDEVRIMLSLGDVLGGLDRLSDLPEDDRSSYDSWIDNANQHVAAYEALARLRAATLSEEERESSTSNDESVKD